MPGKFGQAISLASVDQIYTTTAVGLPWGSNADWTMNLWLYLTNTPGSLAYMAGFGSDSKGTAHGTSRSLLAYQGATNCIYFAGIGADLSSLAPYPLNQWVNTKRN